MLEELITYTGASAAASGAIAIAIRPRNPRYLIGAAAGIPIGIASAPHLPEHTTSALSGAYVGGLVGYLAAHLLTGSLQTTTRERVESYASILGAGAGIAASIASRYF